MNGISLWDSGRKSLDYQFMDGIISEFFNNSGTSIMVHKYIGTFGSVDADGNPITTTDPTTGSTTSGITTQIQDLTLMENRDLIFDPNVYELRGVYQLPNTEISLFNFGNMITNGTIFIELHINDMLALIGRKVIAGDVIELPHLRDDALLNTPGAVNQYYVVQQAQRANSGFQATWWPHLWQIKCEPMTASQEYADILSQPTTNPLGLDDGVLSTLISTTANYLDINEAIVEQAQANFLRRNYETRHYWIVPGDGKQAAWVFTGDGIPPDGAVLSGSGGNWPEEPTEGMYFLRTDYRPHSLYIYHNSAWRFQEVDLRQTWSAASRLMAEFINNQETATFSDGSTQPSRQSLYQTVKPTADF